MIWSSLAHLFVCNLASLQLLSVSCCTSMQSMVVRGVPNLLSAQLTCLPKLHVSREGLGVGWRACRQAAIVLLGWLCKHCMPC